MIVLFVIDIWYFCWQVIGAGRMQVNDKINSERRMPWSRAEKKKKKHWTIYVV